MPAPSPVRYKIADTDLPIPFQSEHLSLIHIPINFYPFFIQPILRLLFGEDHDEDASKIPWMYRHQFLNVSITPIECSIVCSKKLSDRFFRPLVNSFNLLAKDNIKGEARDKVQIVSEEFIVVQVDGQGLDPGQRVLELTSPLAMAGISILFKTTYFSDYILVPAKSSVTVTKALEARGFAFSHAADAFVSQLSPMASPMIPQNPHHSRQQSSSSSFDMPAPPKTPPAKDINELQTRTFTRLKNANIVPAADRSIRLISCAGGRESDPALDEQLRNDLLQVLLATCPGTSNNHFFHDDGIDEPSAPDFSARFLSLTLTDAEPISVLLEQSLLPVLGDTLLGSKEEEDMLVPIILDLRDLPLEATGIVCGVACRLAQRAASPVNGHGSKMEEDAMEVSFLSTARAGTVIVKEKELDRALRALRQGSEEQENGG